jgi:hypothetical protein
MPGVVPLTRPLCVRATAELFISPSQPRQPLGSTVCLDWSGTRDFWHWYVCAPQQMSKELQPEGHLQPHVLQQSAVQVHCGCRWQLLGHIAVGRLSSACIRCAIVLMFEVVSGTLATTSASLLVLLVTAIRVRVLENVAQVERGCCSRTHGMLAWVCWS